MNENTKLLKKYEKEGYPIYIVGDFDIKKHFWNIAKVLGRKRGVILSYQYPRQEVIEGIVVTFLHLGVEEKGQGEYEIITEKGDKLNALFIILQKIPKLWRYA